MSRKNHNQSHCKIIKNPQRNIYPACRKVNNRGSEYVYIAPDTNIIFHLAEMLEGRTFKSQAEYNNLHYLLDNSVFGKNGKINSNGKIVMVVLPHVLEELKGSGGTIRESISYLIEKRMIVFELHEKKEGEFRRKLEPLGKEYVKQNIFIKDGRLSNDGEICKEGQAFNLTIVTKDNDFGVNSPEAMQKIMSANRRKLQGDHNGRQAHPISLKDFVFNFRKGEKFPKSENTEYLSTTAQSKLKTIKSSLRTYQKR